MLDEPIQLPVARFRVHSDDPTFRVAWRGGTRFELSGAVSSDPSTELDVSTPDDAFEVSLECRSTPEHAVKLLRRTLPRGIVMSHETTAEGIEVVFNEAYVPAATPPRLRLFSTDLVQRLRQLDENKVEFIGATGSDCHLSILCDRRRVTVQLAAGTSAQATAARVGSSMPFGYRALVDGPIVTVWKDADFFSMVA
jgi:hypothetical protein